MKRVFALLLAALLLLSLTACGCEHEWAAATCTDPMTCNLCGETEGAANGHVWLAATCEDPKTCEICAATDGEAKGHSMVEATCEESKHCERCTLVEGEALGHTWLEATTETPQTCETCAVTEGERIITDPRFTTAATKEIQGRWGLEMPMNGILGAESDIVIGGVYLVADFGNDGVVAFKVEATESFTETMKQYTVESIYAEFVAQGATTEEVDEFFTSNYGMSVQEYVDEQFTAVDVGQLMNSIFGAININGVYYVKDGVLYTGDAWDAELTGEAFTISGDTLSIEGLDETMGVEGYFVRMAE